MYGFKIAFVKRHKFSFVGFLIQFIESLNVIVLEKRLYWLPFFHVAFYDEHLGLWFNADLMRVEKMTDKQFNEKYKVVKTYDFNYIVPPEARDWLLDQTGRIYSIRAIFVILRKILRGWIGRKTHSFVNGDQSYICTELVLKSVNRCGFVLTTDEIEISTIYETHQIIDRIT